jgi:hypothetical protein
VAIVAFVVLASPANAECSSQIDANTGGMVVYKCDEPEGAAGAALTEQLPANQTIVFKNGDARAVAVPDEIVPSIRTAPEKEMAAAKSENKAKPLKKRKKKVAATVAPQRIIHLKKPTLGQRIRKFFRFGSDSSDS